jgi:hypothetical protein
VYTKQRLRTLMPEEESTLCSRCCCCRHPHHPMTGSDRDLAGIFGVWTRSPHRVVEVIRDETTGGVNKMQLVSPWGWPWTHRCLVYASLSFSSSYLSC